MVKRTCIALVMFAAALVIPVGYGQQCPPKQTTDTLEGRVVKADWVGSTFTVRCFTESDFTEKKFLVSSETKYSKDDDEDFGLSDLEESDLVTVEYYTDSAGILRATAVTVVTD